MKEKESSPAPSFLTPERIKALSDGVFAIVMTLLVLELAVPVVMGPSHGGGLGHALLEMWSEFLFYVLSFLILGFYWIMHHTIFEAIIKYDSTIGWLNVFYLMFVSLIPFTTSLFGRYPGDKIAVIVYGVNLLLMFLMGFVMWSYATANYRLVYKDLDPKIIKGGKLMGYVYFAILLIAIGIAFVSPLASTIIYGAFVAAIILLTMLGRTSEAFIVSVKEKRKKL